MIGFGLRGAMTGRYAVGGAAGLLLALSFPKVSVAGLAWIAPAIMLGAALGRGGWERFRIGYVAGLFFYLAQLYWLLFIPFRWHGIPVGPAAGWLALSAYMALYPAIWVWMLSGMVAKVRPREDGGKEPTAGFVGKVPGASLMTGWLGRTGVALYAGVSWVALEMIIARLFTGFPWDLLGVSQYQMLPLIQVASVTGVYGVSFLVVWVSVSLLMAGLVMVARPAGKALWVTEIALPVIALALIFNHGFRQLQAESGRFSRTLKVAMVQPSIPQTLIWDSTRNIERFREVIRISEAAMTNKPDLLIWPESAVPSLFRGDQEIYEAITGLARKHAVWMIIGADDFAPRANPEKGREVDYFNASFLISPDGHVAETYRKRSLVIFGEYVPLERWVPFMKYLTPIDGGFTPGERSTPFVMDSLGVVTSALICFEDIFTNLSREGAQPDTDFLVNLTNDGWFGESAAPWQHAATAVFRTVENRIPLLRCSNNGLTCWVDERGRIREVFRDAKGSEYGAGFMISEVPLLGPDELREPTIYHRHGDRFGWVCVLLTVIWLPFKLRPVGGSDK